MYRVSRVKLTTQFSLNPSASLAYIYAQFPWIVSQYSRSLSPEHLYTRDFLVITIVKNVSFLLSYRQYCELQNAHYCHRGIYWTTFSNGDRRKKVSSREKLKSVVSFVYLERKEEKTIYQCSNCKVALRVEHFRYYRTEQNNQSALFCQRNNYLSLFQ